MLEHLPRNYDILLVERREKALRTFRIVIYNASDVIIEDVKVKGNDGNDALFRYIKDQAPIIYDGDTIRIEEE